MAISLVSKGNDAGAGAATTLVTTAAAHTAGNLLVLGLTCAVTRSISTVTDTAGNTYINTGQTVFVGGGDLRLETWYAKNIIGNASNQITITYDASSGGRRASWLQYSGMDKDNPLDQGSTAVGNSNAPASASVTTQQALEVIVSLCRINTGTLTAGTGYTMENQPGAGSNGQEDQIVTARGSFTGAFANTTTDAWSVSLTTWRGAQTRQLAALGVG